VLLPAADLPGELLVAGLVRSTPSRSAALEVDAMDYFVISSNARKTDGLRASACRDVRKHRLLKDFARLRKHVA